MSAGNMDAIIQLGVGLYGLDPSISEGLDEKSEEAGVGMVAILAILDAEGYFKDADEDTLDRLIDLVNHPFKAILEGAMAGDNGPLFQRQRAHALGRAQRDGAGEAPNTAEE